MTLWPETQNQLLPLDEEVASSAVFVFVSGSDRRTDENAFGIENGMRYTICVPGELTEPMGGIPNKLIPDSPSRTYPKLRDRKSATKD